MPSMCLVPWMRLGDSAAPADKFFIQVQARVFAVKVCNPNAREPSFFISCSITSVLTWHRLINSEHKTHGPRRDYDFIVIRFGWLLIIQRHGPFSPTHSISGSDASFCVPHAIVSP